MRSPVHAVWFPICAPLADLFGPEPGVLQDGQLLAQGEDFKLERHSAPDGRDNHI